MSVSILCADSLQRRPKTIINYPKYTRLQKDQQNIANNFTSFGVSDDTDISFFIPKDGSLCRVIEVWRKESKPRYRIHDPNNGDIYKIDVEDYQRLFISVNEQRKQQAIEAGMDLEDVPFLRATWFMDDYWYYYYLTPFGDILDEERHHTNTRATHTYSKPTHS